MKRRWVVAILLALVAAGWMSREKFCQIYPGEPICVAPTPEPTPEPTPTPTAAPTPTPEPTPGPTPTPPAGACPWKLSDYPGAELRASTKPQGQGFDHTTLVVGSRQYCADRGWTDGRSRCQVSVDEDPNKLTCELEFGSGGCPRWEFRSGGVQNPCVDDRNDVMSCDHFGTQQGQDDPNTPEFEGKPTICGRQRDEHGPVAGFFAYAHTSAGIPGEVHSCTDASFTVCGDWQVR